MDAILLVGGEGTRLRPLTYDTPKQMLPIVDRALVVHVVSWLASHGVDRVVLSLGYRADAFTEAFPENRIAGVEVRYAVEPEPRGTAGGIRFAAEYCGVEGRVLVVNADVLTDQDASALVAFHEQRGAEASISLTPVEEPSAFGVVVTEDDGRVSAFIEKPPPGTAPTNLINAGVYVLEHSALQRIPDGPYVSIERETFPAIAGDGTLFAFASDAYWLDTGTPAKYLEAQLDILGGRRTAASAPWVGERSPGVFAGPDTEIGGAIVDRAYVGSGGRVAPGSVLACAVIGDGATVAAGSRVTRSVVMAGASIGSDCVIEDSIVGPMASVGSGVKLSAFTVVRGGAVVNGGTAHEGEKIGGR